MYQKISDKLHDVSISIMAATMSKEEALKIINDADASEIQKAIRDIQQPNLTASVSSTLQAALIALFSVAALSLAGTDAANTIKKAPLTEQSAVTIQEEMSQKATLNLKKKVKELKTKIEKTQAGRPVTGIPVIIDGKKIPVMNEGQGTALQQVAQINKITKDLVSSGDLEKTEQSKILTELTTAVSAIH
jgi:hypothetical protein